MMNLLASGNNIKLRDVNDAMDVIASGLPGCIFTLDDLEKDFLDLQNGIAGEVFQKFVTYSFPVAIILPSDHEFGDRITELARDHANHNCIRFFTSLEQAEQWLTKTINAQ